MATLGKHLWAIWQKKCPRCLQGAIYVRGNQMNPRCPVCGLVMEREQGYFLGAMYVSYTLATLFLGLAMLVVHFIVPEWDLGVAVLLAGVVFIPFVPAVTRYSRIIWIHFDRWAWPESEL